MASPTNFGMGAQSGGYGVLPNAQYLYGREGLGYGPQGQAGIPQITQQGWAQQLQGLGQQMPIAQQFGQLGQGMAGQFGEMSGNSGFNAGAVPGILDVGSSMDFFDNPHLDSAIEATQSGVTDQFNRSVMPQMNRGLSAAGPGAYSSDRAGIAEGLAQGELQKNLGNIESTMRQNAYNQGMQGYLQDRGQTLNAAQQSASNMMGMPTSMAGAAALGMMPGQLQQQLGGTMQGIGQQQQAQMAGLTTGGMNQWNWNRNQPYERFNQYSGSMSPYIQYGQSGSSTMPQPYNPYPSAGLAGGIMQGIQGGLNAYNKSYGTP